MSIKAVFKTAFAVQRNYGYPAQQEAELRRDHLMTYRAAGFCAADRQQVFFGWVNEERWYRWLRLKIAWHERRVQANQ